MDRTHILAAVKAGELTIEQATQLLEQSPLTFKVSEKKAVSVYGLYRYPTTLYPQQWLRLLDQASELREFITAEWPELQQA